MWLSDLFELIEILMNYCGDAPIEYLDYESDMKFELNDLILTEDNHGELIACLTNKVRRERPNEYHIN